MSHIATVQQIYEAFGRGEVPAVLAHMDPEVEWEAWEDNHAQRAGLPTMEARRGPDGVAAFLAVVGAMEIRDFQVLDLLASERQVAAEVRIETGAYRDEEMHLWTFGADGRVVRLRHYVDTAKHMAATKT